MSPTPDQLRALAAYCRTGHVKTAATELGLAPQTIRNHLARAYRTLGVGTALEAAAKLGWLRVPEQRADNKIVIVQTTATVVTLRQIG